MEHVGVMIFNLFKGRINRRIHLIGNVAILAVGLLYDFTFGKDAPVGIIGMLIFVVLIIFAVSLSVRRLHDLGKSGWFILLSFVPVINIFYGIYLVFFPGEKNSNKYGLAPSQDIKLPEDLLSVRS